MLSGGMEDKAARQSDSTTALTDQNKKNSSHCRAIELSRCSTNLSVLSVAYPFAPVRPDTAGGAEHVLRMLDKALTESGHRSVVVAAKGSSISGELIEIPAWPGRIGQSARENMRRLLAQVLAGVLSGDAGADRFDIVHMHGVDFAGYLPSEGHPVLVTLHLWPDAYGKDIYRAAARNNTYFNCVSSSQAKACAFQSANMPVIENGVPVMTQDGRSPRNSYALCLGRICPEKGYHLALDAAKSAGIPLIIAGEVFPYPEHEIYFKEEILPRLDGKRYKFIGRVGGARKAALLQSASCLLLPSTVAETSSLVAMEALGCGTPVIAFASGALPEIIEDGKTGFIVNGPREMGRAILKSGLVDREACITAARKKFSVDRMCRQYFELYREITGNK